MDRDAIEPADDLFRRLLNHSRLAGACRIVSRRHPDEAAERLEQAEEHSDEAARLLAKLMDASEPPGD